MPTAHGSQRTPAHAREKASRGSFSRDYFISHPGIHPCQAHTCDAQRSFRCAAAAGFHAALRPRRRARRHGQRTGAARARALAACNGASWNLAADQCEAWMAFWDGSMGRTATGPGPSTAQTPRLHEDRSVQVGMRHRRIRRLPRLQHGSHLDHQHVRPRAPAPPALCPRAARWAKRTFHEIHNKICQARKVTEIS